MVATTAVQPATRTPARTRAAGVGLVVGAVALAVAESIHPQGAGSGPAGLLESFAAHPGRWTLWSLLIMAMAMACLPGVVAWHGRARGRGGRLTTAGAIVFGAALVAMFSFGESNGEGVGLAGGLEPVPADVVAAYTRLDSTGVTLFVMFLIAVPGFHLGLPLLLAGLARAGLVPVWLAVVGGVAALASIGVGGIHPLLGVAAFLVVAATLAFLGVRLVRTVG